MPARKRYHHFWVLITFYASEEVKARVERGDEYITGPDQLGLERVYFGPDERSSLLRAKSFE